MRKPIKVPLNPPKEDFRFGNCAAIAISQAFSIPFWVVNIISRSLKFNIHEGLDYWQCKKLIDRISHQSSSSNEYVSNKTNVRYIQLAVLLKGRYLVMFHNHLSYMENGQIYDRYFDEEDILKITPTGWWEIK